MSLNLTSAVGAGLGSGIDINTVIEQLVMLQRQPINALEQRQNAFRSQISALSQVRNKVDAVRTAANGLAETDALNRWNVTSSQSDAVSVAANQNAQEGSFTFTVTATASAHSLRSVGTIAGLDTAGNTMASGSSFALGSNLAAIGIGGVTASGVTNGTYDVTVLSEGSAAVMTSSGMPASITIGPSNNSMNITVDGVAYGLSLTNGTYDKAGIAAALNTALANAGAGATSVIENGELVIRSTSEGSASSLRVQTGTLATALKLTAGTTFTGTDATVDVGGTTVAVANNTAGATFSATVGGGTITFTLDQPLTVGSGSVEILSAGDGSLRDVVAAINAAGGGVRAQAVQVAPGSYRLQLTSETTGADARLNIDTNTFSAIGGMITASEGRDAELTIGQGAGAYTVRDADGVFDGLVEGWTVTAKNVSDGPVTLSVTRDNAAVADQVEALVKAVNDALIDIKAKTRYGLDGTASGALAGDATLRSVASRLVSSFTANIGSPGLPGVSISRQATLEFDRTKFLDAYAQDPSSVARIMSRNATTDDADVAFVAARNTTAAGSYAIDITQAATKATSAVAYAGGATAAGTITTTRGSTTVSVSVASGESASDIVQALNARFEAEKMSLVAELASGGVRVSAQGYGSSGEFSIDFGQGAGAQTYTGLDVQGTIDGVAGTGTGQFLSIAGDADSGAAGLRVKIAGDAIGSRGSIDYDAGVAGMLAYLTNSMLVTETGSFALAEKGRQSRIDALGSQIDAMEIRVDMRETMLRRQYANLDSTLGVLRSQQTWLSQQVAGLAKVE